MSAPRSPRWARRLLLWCAPPEDARFLEADLEEELEHVIGEKGPARARLWYASQVLRSAPQFVFYRLARWRRPTFRSRSMPVRTFLLADLRSAFRALRRAPGPALAVVATVALAVGAGSAVLTAAHALLVSPLPFGEGDRLVWIHTSSDPSTGGTAGNGNPQDLEDLARETRTLSAIVGWAPPADVTIQVADGEPFRGLKVEMTAGLAAILDLPPALGRWPTDEELRSGANVAVVSQGLWARRFGGDPDILGRSLSLDDRSVRVVGIAPDLHGSFPPERADVWVPRPFDGRAPAERRGDLFLTVVGRLAPGVELADARADVLRVMGTLAASHPSTNRDRTATVQPYRTDLVRGVSATLLLVGATVGLALLIACGNVATILLARAHSRRGEFAVRTALGGTRGRLVAQLLVEHAVLALLGGLAGVALGPVLLHALVAAYPGELPQAAELSLSPPILLGAFALTLFAALLGSLPSLGLARAGALADPLRDGARAGLSRRARRTGSLLVVGQVATSVVLLFAGSLLLGTFWRLTARDPGFSSTDLVAFSLAPTEGRFPADDAALTLLDRMLERVRALPGVQAAGYSTLLPFDEGNLSSLVWPQGVPLEREFGEMALWQGVSAGYTETLGLELVRGRGLDEADAGRAVALINASLAGRLYPDEDPLGRALISGGQQVEIVGVVSDKRHRDLRSAPLPEVFVPRRSTWFYSRAHWFLVRLDPLAAPSNATLAAAVREVDALTPPAWFGTVDERIARSLAPERFRGVLVGGLAALALLLTALGIWGTISHFVGRQTREIGIRIALGQAPGRARRRVVGDALRIVVVGLVVGGLASPLAGRVVASYLVGVRPWEPALLLLVATLFGAIGVAAAAGPALRASRVDPATVMRAD